MINYLYNTFILIVLFKSSISEYTKLEWSLCGPSDIDFKENTLTPMPMIFPDPVDWKFKADLKRPIDGPLKSNVTITRTVSGLTVPIRCYIVNGNWVGSCSFPDLCESIMYITDLDKDSCPESFKENGVDCTCPFNLPTGLLELEDIIQTYSPAFINNPWLLSGDFRIKVIASDKRGYFFCLDLGFTIKSRV